MSSSIESVDKALFEKSSFELSYRDPTQKLLIRNHLEKFFQDFPYFLPSTDNYTYFDGTTINLIYVSGFLHMPDYLPEVSLIIWVHENYPFMAPMIYILSNYECPIRKNHSFINPSGVVTTPYMRNWDSQRSNLCDLVHNLVKLLRHDHPFMSASALKAAIIDGLVARISEDLGELVIQNQHEIEEWSTKQAKLKERGDVLDGVISELKSEHDSLLRREEELREYNNKLLDWLKRCESYKNDMASTAQFEIVGEKSKMVDCKAADKALDDVMYSLDKALEQGVIDLDVYMRQLRVLAREQFFARAMLHKLKKSTS